MVANDVIIAVCVVAMKFGSREALAVVVELGVAVTRGLTLGLIVEGVVVGVAEVVVLGKLVKASVVFCFRKSCNKIIGFSLLLEE